MHAQRHVAAAIFTQIDETNVQYVMKNNTLEEKGVEEPLLRRSDPTPVQSRILQRHKAHWEVCTTVANLMIC